MAQFSYVLKTNLVENKCSLVIKRKKKEEEMREKGSDHRVRSWRKMCVKSLGADAVSVMGTVRAVLLACPEVELWLHYFIYLAVFNIYQIYYLGQVIQLL